jgi:hypothetical protein
MVELRQTLRRIINARYSVSSWLWIIVSTLSAIILFMMLLHGGPDVEAFLAALPFNGFAWTAGLIVTGFTKIYGMATHNDKVVSWGALVAFCLWVFGAISFCIVGNAVTVVLLILPIMIFNAYLCLGATLREGPGA